MASLTPARRDVAGMKTFLGSVEIGEQLSAVLGSARYGLYAIRGASRQSLAGDVAIADQVLGGPRKTVTTGGTSSVTRQPASELRAVPAEPGHVGEGAEQSPSDVRHGDLVTVAFSHHTYGDFSLSGVATSGNDRFILVGPWIISNDGVISAFVTSCVIHARNGDHSEPIPAVRGALDAVAALETTNDQP